MQEPVLYNKFIGKEVYRFTLLRSFGLPPIVIRIEKSDPGIYIVTKELQHDVDLPFSRTDFWENEPNAFAINKTKKVSNEYYQSLTKCIDSINLYTNPSKVFSMGADGSEWIFEVQTINGYFFMHRWSPKEETPMRAIGALMVSFSNIAHKKGLTHL